MTGQCPICQEIIIESTVLDCKHTFCYDRIWSWCQQNNACPLCRTRVSNLETAVGDCPIGKPAVSYADSINEYIVRRDYYEAVTLEAQSDLVGFVVSDSESESYNFDEDDVHINVKLQPSDYQPVSSRTRSRIARI